MHDWLGNIRCQCGIRSLWRVGGAGVNAEWCDCFIRRDGVSLGGGVRGRGALPLPVMAAVMVIRRSFQRRLCLCSVFVFSVCRTFWRPRLRLWIFRGAVMASMGLLPSVTEVFARYASDCAQCQPSLVCSRGWVGLSKCPAPWWNRLGVPACQPFLTA